MRKILHAIFGMFKHHQPYEGALHGRESNKDNSRIPIGPERAESVS